MSGRGSRKRGRPPKTPNERASGRFNYQLLKKPKYLSEGKSQPSTPSASRGISPQSDEGSRSSHNNHTNRSRGSAAKRGRGRKSAEIHFFYRIKNTVLIFKIVSKGKFILITS